MPGTAKEQYDALSNVIQKQLGILGKRLKAHKSTMTHDPLNWGFAGDLDYVSEKLDEILASFNPRN